MTLGKLNFGAANAGLQPISDEMPVVRGGGVGVEDKMPAGATHRAG